MTMNAAKARYKKEEKDQPKEEAEKRRGERKKAREEIAAKKASRPKLTGAQRMEQARAIKRASREKTKPENGEGKPSC